MESRGHSASVAAVVCAQDNANTIAVTVRAIRAIPNVDLVLVVDDGSEDGTDHRAREAGAVVIRHSHTRGRAAAAETGAAVVAMRDVPGRLPRALLFIDPALGELAVNCAALVPPVLTEETDCAVGVIDFPTGAKMPVASRRARRAVRELSGWSPRRPLSTLRCVSRRAFDVATPLARGWGLEIGMTLDLLRAGFTVTEYPLDFELPDSVGSEHRMAQLRDVTVALQARSFRRIATIITRPFRARNPR